MNIMTEIEKAYVACAIDTEGSIGFNLNNGKKKLYSYASRIQIANTKRKWLEYLRDTIGYGSIHLSGDPSLATNGRKVGWNQCYQLTITSNQAGELLPALKPYLRLKHRQAALVMKHMKFKRKPGGGAYSKKKKEALKKLYKKMQKLNKRGKCKEAS